MVFIAISNGKYENKQNENFKGLSVKANGKNLITMDSYDEVHDVKDGREITTPELDVSSAIKFVNSERDDEDDDDKEDFVKSLRSVPDEVNFEMVMSHAE
jgi:hypothetical protein